MKNHRRFEELIQGYVDNALDDKELKALKKHLESCKECAKMLEERKELLGKIHSSKEEIQCPDNLIDNILKNTTRKETPEIISTFKIRWKYLAISAAAVIIVISTVLVNMEEIDRIPTISKEPGAPELAFPEKKKDLASREKDEGTSLSGSVQEYAEIEKTEEQAPPVPEKSESRPLIKTDMYKAKAPPTAKTDSKIKKPAYSYTKDVFASIIRSGSGFEETRFVFPEEGSVVGNDFEIVLILENPKEEIEISLDGEKITNYTKEKNPNIIFIGSDSIPPLEEGLHFLSLKTKEEKNITFYKEG